MILRTLYVFLMTLMLFGCMPTPHHPIVLNRDGIDALVLTDDYKVTYIKKHGDLDRMCATPETDTVPTGESGLSFGSSVLGKSDVTGLKSGTGELSLGGRSPLVLITRELMFRACEMTNNLNCDEKTTREVYKMFLDTLEKLSLTDLGQGSESLASPVSIGSTQTQNESSPSEESYDADE